MTGRGFQRLPWVVALALAGIVWGGCLGGGGKGGDCSEFGFPADTSAGVASKSCGNSYAAFQGHITSADPRWNISQCRASILDENGDYLLDEYVLPQQLAPDTGGELVLQSGCASGLTPADVGTFVFTTTRTTGVFTFTVKAHGDNMEILQTASAQARATAYPPVVSVELAMQIQ